MSTHDLWQVGLFLAGVLVAGAALAPWLSRVLRVEATAPEAGGAAAGWLAGGAADLEQDWASYARALLWVNGIGLLWLLALLMLQGQLPFNPRGLPGMRWDLALNTAVSFVTNTNWQAYSGEATLSPLSQMAGLAVQNFLSAGTGLAVAAALARGLLHSRRPTLGNFHADLSRSVFLLLLPLSVLFTLFLVQQGVPQLFADTVATQAGAIPIGPVASQVAIKMLGTNGGGYFGVNAAHPFENPTALSNLVQSITILSLPAACLLAWGRWVRDRAHARALYLTVFALFAVGLAVLCLAERAPVPGLDPALVDTSGGGMEGKEVRFGPVNSAIWGAATTAASNGSVNAMHDSFTPLGGLVALVNMLTGEVLYGGVGSGLYGLLLYVMLAVFLAGLMVGRTPSVLGKKLETREMRWVVLALLTIPVAVIGLGALAAALPGGLASLQERGPHGFSELLYAYASAGGNNGSAFGGFTANVPLHNVLLAAAMLIGRFGMLLPVLAIAGLLARKPRLETGPAQFPTHGPVFAGLLATTLVVFGALTFLPALALGPVAEALQ